MRDSTPFDALWTQAVDEVTQDKAGERIAVLLRLNEDSKKARQAAFKRVFKATEHSELTSCIADDFGLLTEAWMLAMVDQPS